MPAEIVQHGHCHVCGRVVKYGETTCSEACQTELERTKKGRKRMMLFMYVMMAVFILFLLLGPLLAGGN